MIVNIVVAAAENNTIGKDNKLLWHLPNDLIFFKNITWGMPVIMGRKTFDSLGVRLKGRTNIVITRTPGWKKEHVIVTHNLDDAVQAAKETDARECYVIGGGEIYKAFLPIASRIYMTRVHTKIEGDAFFPRIDEKDWALAATTAFEADQKHAFPYSFEVWEKK